LRLRRLARGVGEDDLQQHPLRAQGGDHLRLRRLARGVGEDDLHLAPGEGVVALLEEEVDTVLHLLAARGQRPRAHREKADAQGLALRERAARKRTERGERQQNPDRKVHNPSSGRICCGGRYPTSSRGAGLQCGHASRAPETRRPLRRARRALRDRDGGAPRAAELRTRRRRRAGDGERRVPRLTGGGCTRSSVLLEAMRAIADGRPRLLSLSPEPEGGDRPGVVFLPMTCESGGTVEIYVEPVLPAARLVIFGGSPAARVLSRIAHAMGYRVDVVDADADESSFPDAKLHRSVTAENIPQGAHVLVATMGDRDIEAIEQA